MITDGERVAKLSDIGKGVRFKELEERFDQAYDVWHSQQVSRMAVDELTAGPKTHDGMSPEERKRAEAQHDLDRLKADRARDPIELLDTVDQDYLYWSSVQEAYRGSERRIALEKRQVDRLQADMTRQRQWENRRHKELMTELGALYADGERARSTWLKLEMKVGVKEADEMVRQEPTILGVIRHDLAKDSQRQAQKAIRAVVSKRRQWRDARDRVAVAFERIERQQRALQRAVADYEGLKRSGGDVAWIRRVMMEKIKARARALDRVTGDLIHRAELADERKEQLHRAWRRHAERKRQRERERAARGLGL